MFYWLSVCMEVADVVLAVARVGGERVLRWPGSTQDHQQLPQTQVFLCFLNIVLQAPLEVRPPFNLEFPVQPCCSCALHQLQHSIYAVPASLSHPASGLSLHSLHLGLVGSIPPSMALGFRACSCAAMIIQYDSLLHRNIDKKFFFFLIKDVFSLLSRLLEGALDDGTRRPPLEKWRRVEGPHQRILGKEKNLQQLLEDSFPLIVKGRPSAGHRA